MSDIKPCPFCGGTDFVQMTAYVYCSTCHACGPDSDDDTDGVGRWNAAPRRGDVPVAVAVEETLHDRYVMAALTGLKSGEYGSFADMVHDARGIADAAMKARKT